MRQLQVRAATKLCSNGHFARNTAQQPLAITAVSRNPFPATDEQHKTLHFYFLESAPPHPDLASLDALKSATEQFTLIDSVFYLHAPDGIGRSKLAVKVERALGVPATARNWRTVNKLLEMGTAVSP